MFSSCVDDNLVVSQVGNFIRTTLMITVSLIFFLVVCFIYMSFLIVCFYICRIVFFMMMTIVGMTVAIVGNRDKSWHQIWWQWWRWWWGRVWRVWWGYWQVFCLPSSYRKDVPPQSKIHSSFTNISFWYQFMF